MINLDAQVDFEVGVEDSGRESIDINGDCVDLVGNKFPETCFTRKVRRMESEE